MERHELERRLIDFVNRMRPDADPPLAIDAETALFEEGIVNSLRILDLIAFVEEITRTRIPDAAVLLANFRSVRVIAAAFGEKGGERATQKPAPPKACEAPFGGAAAVHLFARQSGRTGFSRPVDDLTANGMFAMEPPGRAVFRGSSRRLLGWFDSVVRGGHESRVRWSIAPPSSMG